jgi:hypothetical protein
MMRNKALCLFFLFLAFAVGTDDTDYSSFIYPYYSYPYISSSHLIDLQRISCVQFTNEPEKLKNCHDMYNKLKQDENAIAINVLFMIFGVFTGAIFIAFVCDYSGSHPRSTYSPHRYATSRTTIPTETPSNVSNRTHYY